MFYSKFIYKAFKPKSFISFYFCCDDLVKELNSEGYKITCKKYNCSTIRRF